MRGKKAFLAKGQLPQGTGKGLYGYKWDKTAKKRVPLEFEAKIVQKIFTMLAEGVSCFEVARTLNEQGIPTKAGCMWHPRTIRNMAVNPAYIGITYFGKTRGSQKSSREKQPEVNWYILPDITPPIIDKGLFDKVQEIRQRDRELHRAKAKHDYLLRSHVYCGYCGSPLVGSFLNHRFRYYHCRGAYSTATRKRICNARYIRADSLEDIVWLKAREVLEDPGMVLAGVKEQLKADDGCQIESLEKEIKRLKRRIKGYDAQEKRLVQLFRYGEFNRDNILDELNSLKNELQKDSKTLEDYSETKERLSNLKTAQIRLAEYCQQLKRNLENASYQEKREILDMLAIRVTATTESVDIQGVIPLEDTSMQSSDSETSLLTTGRTWA